MRVVALYSISDSVYCDYDVNSLKYIPIPPNRCLFVVYCFYLYLEVFKLVSDYEKNINFIYFLHAFFPCARKLFCATIARLFFVCVRATIFSRQFLVWKIV